MLASSLGSGVLMGLEIYLGFSPTKNQRTKILKGRDKKKSVFSIKTFYAWNIAIINIVYHSVPSNFSNKSKTHVW